MKNASITLIGRQLFLISILAILPVGCSPESQEQEKQISEKTEILNPNNKISEEDKDSELTLQNIEASLDPNSKISEEDKDSELTLQNIEDPVQEIVAEQPVELVESENVVYFDFDSADLTEEAKVKLRQVSQKLLNSERKITIVGHADERGPHDYNMDLGRRRAEAVKDFLANLWAEAQLSTVSYGETQPKVQASNPQAWAANRRVEFTIVESTQATRSR